MNQILKLVSVSALLLAVSAQGQTQAQLKKEYTEQTHKTQYFGTDSKAFKTDADHLVEPTSLEQAKAEIYALTQARITDKIVANSVCDKEKKDLMRQFHQISQNGSAQHRKSGEPVSESSPETKSTESKKAD